MPAQEPVAGSVDSHVHIIDPDRFPPPLGPGHKPGPDETGTVAMLAARLDAAGIVHAVLVQLSGYGTDNRCLLDALEQGEGRFRAIASLPGDIDDRALDRLAKAGIVGVRFNVANLGVRALIGQERLLACLAERGWVAQIQCPISALNAVAPLLHPESGAVLIDHFGLPETSAGLEQIGLDCLRDLGARGAYLKLSGAFRLSRLPWPHPDLDEIAKDLLACFPAGRRVWGSDWPFVACPVRPRYRETLSSLTRWLPDPADRIEALASTPARLYGLLPGKACEAVADAADERAARLTVSSLRPERWGPGDDKSGGETNGSIR